jgi:hypothetical protein
VRGEPARENGAIPVRLVVGLLVLALGAIALGNNLGWLEGREVFRAFLPAALVVIGVALLLQPAGAGPSRWWSLVWILAGVWIHAHRRGWIELEFWDVVLPGALLVLGTTLVWRVVAGDRLGRRRRADAPGASLSSYAVMAGNEVRAVTSGFRGADLVAFMGGIVLDLTQAKLEEGEAIVDAFAMWGGVEIRVPRDWSVESRVVPFMAAYEDKTQPSTAPPVGRLVVRGAVIMGGIEVRN